MPVAKFRVIAISHRLQGSVVEMLPVTPKSEYEPHGSEENKKFWDATPAGEIKLSYHLDAPIELELGSHYRIHFTETDENDPGRRWKLFRVGQTEDQMDVHFGMSWDTGKAPAHGEAEMLIRNKGAWPHFEGKAGTYWDVIFEHVPVAGEKPSYPC